MKIVVPMAGLGTRLRPHTWSKPKPLVSVAGKPVLGHVMDMLDSLPTLEEAVLIVGYLGQQIRDYMENTYPQLQTRYVVQEEMLGQSHAIWLAREGLTGPMCMVFVDTIVEADLSGLATEQADAVAWVKEVDDPRRFGVVHLAEDGYVQRLVEKPQDIQHNLAVVGLYYFKQAERLIQAIEAQMDQGTQLGGEYYLADAINIMLEDGLRMRVESVDVWQDCGKPEALLETNRYLLSHGRDNSAEAQLREGVTVLPPVYIAADARVTNSEIGPYTSIGPGCAIHDSTIRDSIIEAGSQIESSYLAGSLIGRNARVAGCRNRLNIGDDCVIETPDA
ncbi:MAG TPA: nucleotidyltransferase [Chloroflexi bacterium]|nr:nucleotidyltransferase [Chloroflexota bacterium]